MVVCRAGATTLAELAAAGKPAILIPLPTATDDHQRKNAEALGAAGAADVLDQRELTGDALADGLVALRADAARRAAMARGGAGGWRGRTRRGDRRPDRASSRWEGAIVAG